MAANEIEVKSIYDGIIEKLNLITNEKYGDTVRKAIVDALTLIAQNIDTEIGNLQRIVISAETTISTNADQYAAYSTLADDASTRASNLENAKKAITDALSKITSIQTEVIDYQRFETGTTPQYGFDSDLPRLEYVASNSSWILHFPRVPEFKRIVIKRLNWNDFKNNNPDGFADSVDYDPNTGVLTVSVRDPLSRLAVKTKVIKYNDEMFGQGKDAIPVDLSYANDDPSAPVITMTVPHGQKGAGSNRLNYRPYIQKTIWKNGAYTDPTKDFFPEQAVLTATSHTKFDNKFKEGYYSVYKTATPAIDAVMIRFRKSVNNTSTADFKLANTMGASLSFTDNRDFDSEYTLFLPRGCSFLMTIIDVAGRRISRPVYWVENTPYSKIIWGGTKAGSPKWLFGRKADMDAKLASFVTGDNATRKNTLNTYSYGILFGNAKVDGKGDDVDHAWWDSNNYQRTKHDGKGWWDPSKNQNSNKAYNQFLIPISITGIWYQLPEENIFDFPGNNA